MSISFRFGRETSRPRTKTENKKLLTRPGHRRHPARLCGPPRRRLVAHRLDRLGPRPHKGNPFLLAAARKRRVFRKKPVSRMDHVDTVGLGDRYNPFDIEVGLIDVVFEKRGEGERNEGAKVTERIFSRVYGKKPNGVFFFHFPPRCFLSKTMRIKKSIQTHRDGRGRGLAHLIRLVGLIPVRLQSVCPRVDRRRRQTQLRAGPESAHGDLTSVCAHDLLERR